MIKAVFEKGMESAQASGVYQYDAGQDIYFCGVPKVLNGIAQIQFAYQGDAKTSTAIATWDEKEKAWKARIPSKYMQRSRTVNAYMVVVENAETVETVYMATFTPKSRPAPGDEVTEEEKNAWVQLVGEINVAIAEANQAASTARDQAGLVKDALSELTVKETEWETRMDAAEANAQQAQGAAANAASEATAAKAAANASAASAAEAISTAQGAQSEAEHAASRAETANFTADSALSTAMTAKNLASQAGLKINGAHYWALGPYMFTVGTKDWTYDGENDRYYQDFTVSGMTASMIPFASANKIGGNFPLCGCESADGRVRLYMTSEPTVSAMVTLYGLGVRS